MFIRSLFGGIEHMAPDEGTTVATPAAEPTEASEGEAASGQSEPAGDESSIAGGDKVTGWAATLRPDQQGHELAKKFKKNPEVFDELVKLTEQVGKAAVPPADDAPAEEWAAYYQRLGRPEDPDGYELSAGDEDKELVEWYKAQAHNLGLPKKQAEQLFGAMMERREHAERERDSKVLRERDRVLQDLRQEWGDDFEANVQGARRLIGKFGGTEFIEMLSEERADGTKIGDDPRIIRAMVNMYQQVAADHLVEGDTDQQAERRPGQYRYPDME